MEIVNQIVMKKLNEVRPYFKNPRKNDKTVEMLVKVIPQVGFNVPILIDKDGVIVKGHARYKAAFKLGMEEVPCVITSATPEQIALDRITDNKISELSEWLDETLMHEIDSLDLGFSDILQDLDLKNDVIESEFFEVELEKFEQDNPEENEITNEQKQKIYEEMLAKKEQEAISRLEKQIEKEEIKQVEQTLPQKKQYVKCVCSKCGEVFFIDTNKLILVEM